MNRPAFLIVGCGKCGTTALCDLLAQHPGISLSNPKEPDFLSDDNIYARGWDWYDSLWPRTPDSVLRGEGSVSYAVAEFEEKVIERIIEHLPNVRIIYIARHPVARIESVFREHHDSGAQSGWFLPWDLGEAMRYRPAMMENTRYWRRVSAYRRIIPDNRILTLTLEDLTQDTAKTLRRCFEFLGVTTDVAIDPADARRNPGSAKLYDTRFLRWLRINPITGPLLAALPYPMQRTLVRPLRRRFTKSTPWPPGLRRTIWRELSNDAERFLHYCGKPPSFWPPPRDDGLSP